MARRGIHWSQLRELVNVRALVPSTEERLGRAASILDLRRLAARRAPKAAFDYVDGGAEGEVALRRARRAFRDLEFRPCALRDVTTVDPSTELLGDRSELPFALAPTGFTRLAHTEGEIGAARAAERAGIPYSLSTAATTSIEEIAEVSSGRRWFQLYVWRDRGASEELIARARAAGFEALMLTVDTPVAGARLRDARNGLMIPPQPTAKTLLEGALHPAWWWDLLTTAPLEFATMRLLEEGADPIGLLFDASLTFDDIAWVREHWDGPLLVKGLMRVADAVEVVDRGVDAVILSNHGGRQLDRAPTPLHLVRPVAEAVGDRAEVWMDSGILSGADIVAALALGANGTLVGRAFLYGLMAGGEAGAKRAIDILGADIRRTMALLGVTTIDELTPDLVALGREPA